MNELIIYLCLGFIFYTYFGYPLLIILLGNIFSKEVKKGNSLPEVALLIAAYNEEGVIEKKIKNSLALNYPKELLSIFVVSDASNDKTDSIVKKFKEEGVHLIRVEGRVGKTEARNQALKMINSEIIIFSDATTSYNADSIKKLVRNFDDKDVGMVAGHLKYRDSKQTKMGAGQTLFWIYESFIKESQTKLGSLTGSLGCMTAFRRELYTDLPAHIIEDFTEPLLFIKKGKRVVFEKEALCYEETTSKSKSEFKMRVRVIRGGMTGLLYARAILNPFRFFFPCFQLLSHKVFRWLMPIAGIILFISSLSEAFVNQNQAFLWLFILQLSFYTLALLGAFLEKKNIHVKVLGIPFYFMIVNGASLVALYKLFTSRLEATWEPERRKVESI